MYFCAQILGDFNEGMKKKLENILDKILNFIAKW